MFCLITSIYFFIFILPFYSLFKSTLSNFAFYFQDGGKRVHKMVEVLENELTYFEVIAYHYKRLKFYHKIISGRIVFYFSIRGAITAYVGEIRLSQYMKMKEIYINC